MSTFIRKLDKILVANRGEIAIRVMRAASELQIQTVGIYTYEDRYSLHRYKADEAYQIGLNDEPLKPYLDIEAIIALAKREKCDAIHPGYGFLSERVELARRCREEGIIFVGPSPEAMDTLGDKIAAKKVAIAAQVPVIQDSKRDLTDITVALEEATKIGYPIILKAAAGGGGRGMRLVRQEAELARSFQDAKSEALKAFGDDTVFMEKYIDSPKHIEVQILGDEHGQIVHLFERDCSVQRRFQKVIEIAPAPSLKQETKTALYGYALAIARQVGYHNAGTVEFLVDQEEKIYFIEVNPRIQVEHTVTEEVTGIDIVRAQILIAQGYPLTDRRIQISSQDDVKMQGIAIQCRITTEDPENGFKPDFGTIIAYRNAAGFGIRLDEGSSYAGVKISPFFDSMIVKISAKGRSLRSVSQRMIRALREFRIRGVKTNIGFLENVLTHETFLSGQCTVRFIDENPSLLKMPRRLDRATKLLGFLGTTCVNGHPEVGKKDIAPYFETPRLPIIPGHQAFPYGSKDLLNDLGPEGVAQWVMKQQTVLLTDTTLRDAHQSLLATRVRTVDMLAPARLMAMTQPELFSLEVWGGATFDVCLRFLHECPWERLKLIREAAPNVMLQMLFRGSNAVGYTSYPNNLIEAFIEKSAEAGIDVFRIFDSLNWVPQMQASIKAVRERTHSIAQAAICYTGDLQNPKELKYTLQYYLDLAKQVEDAGAHMLAIKDMAGLLKPYAAAELVHHLKSNLTIPIHLHTHDTAGVQSATYLKAIEAGIDVVDTALGGLSGLTSQPNGNSLIAAMQGHSRCPKANLKMMNAASNYWEEVREWYSPFESGLKASTAEVYEHQIPGGQYSNLRPQAKSLGLLDQFETIKTNYSVANQLLGDIVKVTPSSKIVGDLALFMTSNGLDADSLKEKAFTLSFPDSVKGLLKGDLGQIPGGWPQWLQEAALKGDTPYTDLPNEHLAPLDFDSELTAFQEKFPARSSFLDFLSYQMYPKVFEEFYAHVQKYGEIWRVPTREFLYGMNDGDEITIEITKGKSVVIRKIATSTTTDSEGARTVDFELNGQMRRLRVRDKGIKIDKARNRKVTSSADIGAPLQGKIGQILVKPGDKVQVNQALFTIEAMKMESTVTAVTAGEIKEVLLAAGSLIEQDDVIVTFVS